VQAPILSIIRWDSKDQTQAVYESSYVLGSENSKCHFRPLMYIQNIFCLSLFDLKAHLLHMQEQ